jgi:hypothetical protein
MDQLLSQHFISEATMLLLRDQELQQLASDYGIDYAGKSLNCRVEPDVDSATELPYWQKLQDEVHELLCETTPKYKEVRERIAQARHATERFGVPAVAVVIGKYLFLEAALITPYVSLLFLSIVTVGVQAWCSSRRDGKSPFVVKGEPVKLDLGKTEDSAKAKKTKSGGD